MKENDPVGEDEKLSKVLRTWRTEAQLPARFQETVWQRIESSERKPAGSFWDSVRLHIEGAFARPVLAAAYVALLMAAGIGAGFWRAEGRTAQINSEMRSRYVQSIDPYQMPR